jgi:hypothetical protein
LYGLFWNFYDFFLSDRPSVGALTFGSALLITAVFGGIAVAVILSIIPTYTSKHNVNPSGERLYFFLMKLNK